MAGKEILGIIKKHPRSSATIVGILAAAAILEGHNGTGGSGTQDTEHFVPGTASGYVSHIGGNLAFGGKEPLIYNRNGEFIAETTPPVTGLPKEGNILVFDFKNLKCTVHKVAPVTINCAKIQ